MLIAEKLKLFISQDSLKTENERLRMTDLIQNHFLAILDGTMRRRRKS